MKSLVWYRNDLRIHDHSALAAACAQVEEVQEAEEPGAVRALYCVCLETWRGHDMSDWRVAFQLRSLHELAAALGKLGIHLDIINAERFAACPDLIHEYCLKNGIQTVEFIEEYPLDERRRDAAVEAKLQASGVQVNRHVGDVVVAPGSLVTGEGKPFSVFTPFYRKWINQAFARPIEPTPTARSARLDGPNLPTAWDGVSRDYGAELWPGGENAAHQTLGQFIQAALGNYSVGRDQPGLPGTSTLSPSLAVGAISARQVIAAVNTAGQFEPDLADGANAWIREIAWRDFYRHIVAAYDHISMGSAFRLETNALPWRQAPKELAAWQRGETGYPFVDAAMRQLVSTGWMHNRLRMVCAMFLTKHLLIDWREGERFFMQHLVDGDFASNNGGWQWSASTGTDAAPYFRIFNPATQGERFDPNGDYTHKYLPELAQFKGKQLYQPPTDLLGQYSPPIVEHKMARDRALAFFKANR